MVTEAVLLVAVVIVLAVVVIRQAQPAQRDPQRMFTAQQRSAAISRCGGRCEHKSPLWRRCSGGAEHADHIHPWSLGGATSMGNLQMLCAPHNLRKSSWRPTLLYRWRLERRRLRYFPANEPVKVVWRLGAVPPPRRPTGANRPYQARTRR